MDKYDFEKTDREMENQLDLLSYTPIARDTDPETSHAAAAEISTEGTRARQQHITLETVRKFPGRTSQELTRYCCLDRYQLARRLPELEAVGLVIKGISRECSVTHRRAVIWFGSTQKR